MKKKFSAGMAAFCITMAFLTGLWAFALADIQARRSSVLDQSPAFALTRAGEREVELTLLGRTSLLTPEPFNQAVGLMQQGRAFAPRGIRLAWLGGRAIYERAQEYLEEARRREFVQTLLREGF